MTFPLEIEKLVIGRSRSCDIRLREDTVSRLHAALAKTPAIRPEVVERAAALATDPDYPSVAIMGKIGRLLAQSKDLSLKEN